ncbi:hypothetical protein SprV_0301238100 [Sparganum proliferum]
MRASDLLFAGDCALNSTTKEDMQRSMDLFASRCNHCGPTSNMNKRMIVDQQPSTAEYSVPRTPVNGTELKAVDKSKYLGSTMSRCIRRRSGPLDLQSQPSLHPAAELRVESPQPPNEYQTENVQGRCPDDTSLRRGKLGRLLLPCQDAQPLPSQLPPPNTKAEMAGKNTRRGSSRLNWSPHHPRHAAATAITLEFPFHEDRRHKSTDPEDQNVLQGHIEEFS